MTGPDRERVVGARQSVGPLRPVVVSSGGAAPNASVPVTSDEQVTCTHVSPAAPPQVLELATTPGYLVRRAQQVHTALWSRRFCGELTEPQYAVLAALAQEPDIDQTRVGTLASLDKNTSADIVRRLAGQGWIDRATDVEDRRRRRIRLTSAARMALRYTTPAVAEVQVDFLRPLPPRRIVPTIGLLAAVAFPRDDMPFGHAAVESPVLEPSHTPGHLIRRIQSQHGVLWADLVGSVLTGPQYGVLVALTVQPGLDQLSVGRIASLDRSSTADVVARLVRGGWIQRSVDGDDARRSALHLSRGAAGKLRRITPKVRRVQAQLLRVLPADRAAELTSSLRLLAYHDHR